MPWIVNSSSRVGVSVNIVDAHVPLGKHRLVTSGRPQFAGCLPRAACTGAIIGRIAVPVANETGPGLVSSNEASHPDPYRYQDPHTKRALRYPSLKPTRPPTRN